MRYKMSIFILILAVFLFAVAGAWAGDDLRAESDEGVLADSPKTFTQLNNDINESQNTFEVKHDYTFDNRSDGGPVAIEKSNFTINGNNHILDGNRQSGIFRISGNNVTINNLVFINGNSQYGGAINSLGAVTLNNVTFIANNASYGGAVLQSGSAFNCNNSRFIDNHADMGSSMCLDNTRANVSNTFVTSAVSDKYGQIYASGSAVNIENSDFANMSSTYSTALYCQYCENSIVNSRFVNLAADRSAGAIAIIGSGNSNIKGCKFTNTKSLKNAGAIMVNYADGDGNATIADCVFDSVSSAIGGAYVQLGGNLTLNSTNFTNNAVTYGGEAVYLSFVSANINNCIFDSNGAEPLDGFDACGGAIYFDIGNLRLANSTFINNSAYFGGAIYARDSGYGITGCLFADNGNAIFTDLDRDSCSLENNIYNGDSVIANQTYCCPTFIESHALNLTFLNNAINVTAPPSRFDLRDWGWITPVKQQGQRGACWVFIFGEALQTALLKASGISYDISENNIAYLQSKYSSLGSLLIDDSGYLQGALGNALSWYGVVGEDEDVYDEVGRVSIFIDSENKIRLQDAYFIMPNSSDYVGDVKRAILNYGAVAMSYAAGRAPYYNADTHAHYCNELLSQNHGASIIGWDDSYSADNFLISPPGNGAWIVKNSWGEGWGDNGYFYMSYYEKSLFTPDADTNITFPLIACIFNNDVAYHVNYQTDLVGLYDFDGNYTQYSNEFTAHCDDLIAGVGTYFNQSGIDYSFDVYVNGKPVYSQSGASEFAGYRTIVFDRYITIKANDTFKVVFKSNALPYEDYSRQHYIRAMSFVKDGDEWRDITLENKTVCIKAYTVADDSKIIDNADITLDYGGGKYFSVRVVTADGRGVVAAPVTFKINGRTTPVLTGSDGVAKIRIGETPGKYTVKTTYNGKTYSSRLTVKQVLTTSKVTVKKTAKKFTLKAKLKINGKVVKGKVIKFKLNGKTYKVKTNAKGIAQKTLKKSVIKRLKKGKTYTVKVTYLKDTIKTSVKVK